MYQNTLLINCCHYFHQLCVITHLFGMIIRGKRVELGIGLRLRDEKMRRLSLNHAWGGFLNEVMVKHCWANLILINACKVRKFRVVTAVEKRKLWLFAWVDFLMVWYLILFFWVVQAFDDNDVVVWFSASRLKNFFKRFFCIFVF